MRKIIKGGFLPNKNQAKKSTKSLQRRIKVKNCFDTRSFTEFSRMRKEQIKFIRLFTLQRAGTICEYTHFPPSLGVFLSPKRRWKILFNCTFITCTKCYSLVALVATGKKCSFNFSTQNIITVRLQTNNKCFLVKKIFHLQS